MLLKFEYNNSSYEFCPVICAKNSQINWFKQSNSLLW